MDCLLRSRCDTEIIFPRSELAWTKRIPPNGWEPEQGRSLAVDDVGGQRSAFLRFAPGSGRPPDLAKAQKMKRTLLAHAATTALAGPACAEMLDLEKDVLTFDFTKLTEMAPLPVAYEQG